MKTLLTITFYCIALIANAQETIPELLEKFNTKKVPYISIKELAMPKTQAIILDSREEVEYNTSHLKNAILVGYDNFSVDSVLKKFPNINKTVVVYCSIGIRSETVAYKLKKAGYHHVYNLYGGIFEWKNNGFPVYDLKERETDSVHVFSEQWSKLLKKGHKVF